MIERILYFMDFPCSFGGAGKILLTQAHIMQQRGYQVRVVLPNDLNGKHVQEFDQLCKEYDLKVITARYPIATCMEQIDIIEVMNGCGVIKHIIEDFKPDLLHSAQLNITVELAAREVEIPHLMNVYQTDMQMFHVDWMDVYPQYHSTDSILFSERWGKGLGISSRCIRTAYESTSIVRRTDKEKNHNTIKILAVGALYERKNQLEIIKFIMRCKKNGFHVKLEILGNNNTVYGDACKEFVQENGLQNEVVFRGLVLNVDDYYQKADLFILASTVESYPVVIIESMSNSVPIITTPVAGVPELLEDGESGFLTGGYTAEDIYYAFLRYLECRDTKRIDKIINNAYGIYLKQHSYTVVGESLENYYQWIIADYHNKIDCRLKITEIRQKFDQFVYERKMDKVKQTLMRQLWFFYHIVPILEKKDNKSVTIWGAGFWGSIALEWLRLLENQVEFVGFLDSYKHGEYLGFPIIDINDDVVTQCGTVIVALENIAERLKIMDYLEVHDKVRNIDYFMVCNGPIKI